MQRLLHMCSPDLAGGTDPLVIEIMNVQEVEVNPKHH